MNSRRAWLLGGAALAIVAIAALLVAGSRAIWVREFALRVPNQEPVAQVGAAQRVCEGPVISPRAIQGVGIWGGSTGGVSRLTVEVQDGMGGGTLAAGSIRATSPGEYIARLSRPVRGGRPVRVCVAGQLNVFSLAGSSAVQRDVVMTGQNHRVQFSLVLLNHQRSLLSSLPTAFSRASLWRPSWVGSWVYWMLAAALLASFGLGLAAVGWAAADDDDDRPGRGGDGDRHLPPSVTWRPGSSSDPGPDLPATPTPARGGRG